VALVVADDQDVEGVDLVVAVEVVAAEGRRVGLEDRGAGAGKVNRVDDRRAAIVAGVADVRADWYSRTTTYLQRKVWKERFL
jgi:hypothetical protein